MITSHVEALDYCRMILDECGAPGVVREKIEQRCDNEGEGVLIFRTDKDLTEDELRERAYGHTKAQVGYTLPCDPGRFRRNVILNYAPSAISELAR